MHSSKKFISKLEKFASRSFFAVVMMNNFFTMNTLKKQGETKNTQFTRTNLKIASTTKGVDEAWESVDV